MRCRMNTSLIKIGEILTPYKNLEDCPNNVSESAPDSILKLLPEFEAGLSGLKAGDKILVLYWFEKADRKVSLYENADSGELKGNFALRSPNRPNPIAAANIIINNISANNLTVSGLDCISGTWLLDIKPTV